MRSGLTTNLGNRQTIVPLLPQATQDRITPYQIFEPFYSKTTITIPPQIPAIVTVDFKMEGNRLRIKNQPFQHVRAQGRFSNRLYEGNRALQEGKKNIKITLASFKANYNRFKIETTDALITSTPATKTRIKLAASATGAAKDISKWLKNEKFFFKKGRFKLKTEIDGPLNNMDSLLISSSADLMIKDLLVLLKQSLNKTPMLIQSRIEYYLESCTCIYR